jgi:hypothetical protein
MKTRFSISSLIAITLLTLAAATQAATLTVNSAADAGGTCPGATCTLRQAILDAVSDDTINFAAGITTINLTSDELLIDKNLTISGPGANLLTVQRSSAAGIPEFRIFDVAYEGVSFNVTISGLTITNGRAAGGSNGGGISYTSTDATLTVTSCTISGNVADGGGGGIRNDFGTVIITNSILFDNSANNGGGIYNNKGKVSITNSTLSANPANVDGGGMYNNFGTVDMTNSTLSANSVTGNGGGIENHSGGLNITNGTLSGNSADNGGGIRNDDGGEMTMTNSTLSSNSARFVGGIDTSDGDGMAISNTIIAKNKDTGGAPDCNGKVSSQGYNLIGNSTGATITPTTGDQIGTAATPIDPLLGPLQNNGGPTQTQALLVGSPAIDKGAAATDPVTGNLITTDQRGFTRPVDDPAIANATGGNGSDIGAFEMQPVQPAQLLNISTRMRVLTGDQVLIGGFIITGNDPKKVIIRGIGPSLNGVGVTLSDPTLELHQGSITLATNDNWKINAQTGQSQQAEIEATTIPPKNDLESAILITLSPGAYTAILAGKNGGTGVGLVEVYDLDQAANSQLANISTRGFVDTGNNVMIGGLIVGGGSGGGTAKVMVRALGPSVPVAGALGDPTLELHDGSGTTIATNDNWKINDQTGQSQQAEIEATTIPPKNDLESALVAALAPGNYTAIVRGKNNTTGVGLVEAYHLQ